MLGKATKPLTLLQFIIWHNGELIEMPEQRVLLVGRYCPINPIHVDLSHHNAYALGVSRQHLSIEQSQGRYYITDLNSVNGTWLNGHPLKPHTPYEMQHGDELQLGLLCLAIHLHQTQPLVPLR